VTERNTPWTQTAHFIGIVFISCATIDTLSASTLGLFKEVVVVVVIVVVLDAVVVVILVVVVLAQTISHCCRCSRIANRAHEHTYIAKNVLKIEHYVDLPTWLSGLAISGCGAVKAWLAIRQGVGSYPTPAGMLSQDSA